MEVFNFLFNESPIITKILVLSSFAISILVWSGLITTFDIYLNFGLILKKFEIWRILTTFLYFGEFNLNLVLHMFIFFRDSKILEKKNISRKSCRLSLFYIILYDIFIIFKSFYSITIFIN